MAAISTMRSGVAAPRASVARAQTVKVVARGSWRDSATVTASPQASGRSSSAANRVSPTRSVLPANWRQELESLRNGSGSSSSASSAPAPARSSSASWRDAPASSSSAPRSSSSKKPVTPTRSSLPANWKQELEALRGSSGSSNSSYEAAAPARSTSASWRDAPASSSAPRSSSSKKPVTPTRSSLPANWKQELESLRGSSGSSSSYEAPAPARSSSASWRDAPAASAPRPSSPRNKTVTPSRSSLPANWKQELEALRGSSGSSSASAPAPARSSSASWRDAPAESAKSTSPSKQGTNPWTGKSKVEIKRTTLPADWRKGL